MNYLVVENQGELELVGMRLMGASSKRDKDLIGTFGTGWKYAAATVLREAGDFLVLIGTKVINVTVRPTELKGERHLETIFQVSDGPTIDGGFTTGLGKDWKPWMALREIISNAMDEGYLRTEIVSAFPDGVHGKTRVVIPLSPAFEEAWEQRAKLFRMVESPVAEIPGKGRILKQMREGFVCLYKQGIFIGEREADCAFDYDFADIQLGEDRLPREDVPAKVWALLNHAPLNIKKQVLTYDFEASCYPYSASSADWLDAFEGKMVVTKDEGLAEQLVVSYPFEHLATMAGARTKKTDLSMKAADRQTMPADGRVRRASVRLQKLGIRVPPEVVLLANIDRPFLCESGIIYVDKNLSEDEVFQALACAGTAKGYVGSHEHLMALARLIR